MVNVLNKVDYSNCLKPEKTIELAKIFYAEQIEYNAISFNCESFVIICKMGKDYISIGNQVIKGGLFIALSAVDKAIKEMRRKKF